MFPPRCPQRLDGGNVLILVLVSIKQDILIKRSDSRRRGSFVSGRTGKAGRLTSGQKASSDEDPATRKVLTKRRISDSLRTRPESGVRARHTAEQASGKMGTPHEERQMSEG